VSAWAAVAGGARLAWRTRGATAAALLGSTAALLAAEAAARRAGVAWAHALRELDVAWGVRAFAITFVGLALAALIADVTRAAALVAYTAGDASAGEPRLVRAALARTPRLITVRAVELTIELVLATGALLIVLRASRLAFAPWRAAAVGALAAAPAFGLALATFAAARVAMLEAAGGATAAAAIARGYALVLRRLPSLARLAAALALATLPLAALALTCGAAARALAHSTGALAHSAGALAFVVARDGLLAAAALWCYAALARFRA
jgi:hypothetical protein